MYTFSLERIQYLMRHFHKLTNLNCHIYSDELGWINSDTTQPSPLCELIQSAPGGLRACMECDECAFSQAQRTGEAILYRCSFGLTECVVPMLLDHKLVGFPTFGRVVSRSGAEDPCPEIVQRCLHLGLPEQALLDACRLSAQVPADYLEAAKAILTAIASYIVLEQLFEQKQPAAEELDQYLKAHLAEPLTAERICSDLNIGKTQLYKLSNLRYGQGIARQLLQMRIRQAKSLLVLDKSMSVGDVAFACGFSNYNHFIKVFSQEVGLPPNRYRKLHG